MGKETHWIDSSKSTSTVIQESSTTSTPQYVLIPTTLGKSAILLMADPLLSQKLLTKGVSQPAKKIANSAYKKRSCFLIGWGNNC